MRVPRICSKIRPTTHTGSPENINEKKSEHVKFGIGQTITIGDATGHFPTAYTWLKVSFYVVDADVSFLLSVADIDHPGLGYDNTADPLYHKPTGCLAESSANMVICF